jgi:hypothetical protein
MNVLLKKLNNMKKIQLLFLLMLFAITAMAGPKTSPSLDFRLANPTEVNIGGVDYFQFDVEVKATAGGTYHRDMQVYFNYNPDVFGYSVKLNGKIQVEKIGIMAGMFMDMFPKYIWVNEPNQGADNTPSRYAILSEAYFPSNPGPLTHNEITTEFQGYLRVRLAIQNPGPAGIKLIGTIGQTTFMDGGQYYFGASNEPIVYAWPYQYVNDLLDHPVGGAPEPHIVSITPVADITVPYATTMAEAIALLAPTTTIYDSEGDDYVVTLTWNIPGYDGMVAADYMATATFDLPAGVVQSDPPTPLEVNAMVTVEMPEPQYYALTLNVSGMGSILVDGVLYTEPLLIGEGISVTLTAVADVGYFFTSWSGDASGTNSQVVVLMDADKTITANFIEATITDFPWIEGFEDDSPTRSWWAQQYVVGTGNWTFQAGSNGVVTTAYEGVKNARFVSQSGNNNPITKLITPVLDLTTVLDPILSFYYAQPVWAGDQNRLKVYYRTHPTSEWVEIAHYTQSVTVWTLETLVLPNPSATYQIAFEGINNYGYANVVDYVTVKATPLVQDFTLTINKSGMGTVLVNGIEYTSVLTFEQNTVVSLEAIAAAEWDFAGWTGDLVSSMPLESIVMDANKVITASFTPAPISVFPFTETFEDDSPYRAAWTQQQVLGAANWTFQAGSSGGLITTAYQGEKNARFVSVSPSAGNTPVTKLITPILDLTSLAEPVVSFWYGQEVWFGDQNKLKVYYRVSPQDNWIEIAFYDQNIPVWTNEILPLPSPSATYQIAFEGINNWGRANVLDYVQVMEAPVVQMYTLNIMTVGQGTIMVDGSEYTGPVEFPEGTSVTLHAMADMGWGFLAWSGDLVSELIQETLVMDDDKFITATFMEEIIPVYYTLTIDVIGMGMVTVDDQPYTGPVSLLAGTSLDLQAIADFGWNFEAWAGDLVSGFAFETIIMDDDKSITAIFTEELPVYYTLSWDVIGQGSIEVSAIAKDSFVLPEGAQVTAEAIPDPGWEFDYWTFNGVYYSDMAEISFSMQSDVHLIAHFYELPQYTLTLSIIGAGTVHVNGMPYLDPITVAAGTELTLQAVAALGWEFQGWSGDLISELIFETIFMDANKQITAIFTEISPEYFVLNLDLIGFGMVEIWWGEQILKSSEIQIPANELVTATATPLAGWEFAGWSGDIISADAQIQFIMDSDKHLIAIFTEIPADTYELTLAVMPLGTATVSGAGIYEEGQEVMVSAVANPGYMFVNWTYNGEVVSDLPAFVYTMPAMDVILVANFQQIPGQLIVTTTVTGVTCPGDDDGTLHVHILGGQKPYNICIAYGCDNQGMPDKSASTAYYTGLMGGWYTLTIIDANGLMWEECILVPEPEPLDYIVDVDPILCYDEDALATVTITILGGTMPYTWDGVVIDGNAVVLNLAPGQYSYVVNDAHLCGPITIAVEITMPDAITAVEVYDAILCYGETTFVNVIASGGTGILKLFDIVDGDPVFVSDLPLEMPLELYAGVYNWLVIDENLCIFPLSFIIEQPLALEADVSYEPIACYGGTTMVTLTVSGGTPPYYLNGEPIPPVYTVALPEGIYQWTITDHNGCYIITNLVITQPDLLEAVLVEESDPVCPEGEDGYAIIHVTGGTPPYTSTMGVVAGNVVTISGLSAGPYSVVISDSKNCGPLTIVFELEDPDAIEITIVQKTHVLCYGDATGSILVSAIGGTPPYWYSLDGVVWQETGLFEMLYAGVYTVYVKDVNDCLVYLEDVIITQPDELVVILDVYDVTCYGANDGKIVGLIYGGVGPYNVCLFTYCDINGDDNGNPEKSQNFMHWNLVPGQYMIKVTDQNGCEWIQCVTIYEPELLVAEILEWTDVLCYGEATGEATVEVWGGNGGYMFLWSDGQTTQTAVGLAAGEYSVTVTDEKGCIATATVIITQPMEPLSFTYTVGHVLCYGEAEGSIQIHPVGGTGEYSVSGDINALFVQNLLAGTYVITLTDENGCYVTQTVIVDQPDALTVTMVIDNTQCVTDGIPAYIHDWVWYRQGLTNAGNLPNADRSDPDQVIGAPVYADVPGTFFSLGFGGEMIVKFAAPFVNGTGFDLEVVETSFGNLTCNTYPEKAKVWVAQYINEALYAPVQTHVDVLASGDTWYYLGEICLDAFLELGDLPWAQYIYFKDVSNPADFSNTQTSDGYDINGVIALNGLLDFTADVTAFPAGGTPPYSYLWNTGATTQKIEGVGQGTYFVTITDANNCVVMGSAVVSIDCDLNNPDPDPAPLGDFVVNTTDMFSVAAYPNPFSTHANIEFTMSRDGYVTLEVYNLLGERLSILFQGYLEAGVTQQVVLRADNLQRGIYLYKITSGNNTFLDRLILVR